MQRRLGAFPLMWTAQWFVSLFLLNLPFTVAMRVFDIALCDGRRCDPPPLPLLFGDGYSPYASRWGLREGRPRGAARALTVSAARRTTSSPGRGAAHGCTLAVRLRRHEAHASFFVSLFVARACGRVAGMTSMIPIGLALIALVEGRAPDRLITVQKGQSAPSTG